jgi:hypothetical protein
MDIGESRPALLAQAKVGEDPRLSVVRRGDRVETMMLAPHLTLGTAAGGADSRAPARLLRNSLSQSRCRASPTPPGFGRGRDPTFSMRSIAEGGWDAELAEWRRDARDTWIPLLAELGSRAEARRAAGTAAHGGECGLWPE